MVVEDPGLLNEQRALYQPMHIAYEIGEEVAEEESSAIAEDTSSTSSVPSTRSVPRRHDHDADTSTSDAFDTTGF